jgi:O-antigen ligase
MSVSLPFVLCVLFLVVLWIAGGASRSDVLGQVVVRGAAWMCLCLAALFGRRPTFGGTWPLALFLGLALALTFVQLVPLPPSVWQALPGRALLTQAAEVMGETQPWRPISMVPDATRNAAASLVVPFTMLVLMASMRGAERSWLPGVLLGLIGASALLALLQFSGSRINNPLINDTVGQISASFANRNHLALFLAIGCVLAPAWAFLNPHGRQWRVIAALGMLLLFILMILATGSRAGLLLGGLALVAATAMVWNDVRRLMRRYPRWVLGASGTVTAGVIGVAVLATVAANRAISINRILAGDATEDMRSRALPTVIDMIRTYFPVGSGLGGFDPIFRIHEPRHLLKLTYFNHAHNDLLEVALDAGLAGTLLLLGAIGWWGYLTLRAWRGVAGAMLPRLGSVILGLILVASVFDYPARTPMIMAVLVIAAWWLSDRSPDAGATLRT